MRAYIAVSPQEIEIFSTTGKFHFPSAYALTPQFSKDNSGADEEEMEFELSYLAAQSSRSRLSRVDESGFVLAVDLGESQKGAEHSETVELVTDLEWSQVASILVAHSEELELTWFAAQEVKEVLPKWLA